VATFVKGRPRYLQKIVDVTGGPERVPLLGLLKDVYVQDQLFRLNGPGFPGGSNL